MRLMLIALTLLAGAAEARDCEPPKVENKVISGLRRFSECLIREVADLKREQAELLHELEDLKTLLASIPGELHNKNGRVTRQGGARLTQASFSLDARTRDGATALNIDQQVPETLCEIGCTLTLSLAAEGLRETDKGPIVVIGPCVFSYNSKSGGWALSDVCGEPVFGIDGDGLPTGKPGGETILTVGGVCSLADSEPSRSVDLAAPKLGRDRAKGLFLIADPALWTGEEGRFRCELKISR